MPRSRDTSYVDQHVALNSLISVNANIKNFANEAMHHC